MKATVLALALVASCALSVHGRSLLQAPASAPGASDFGNCPATVFDVAASEPRLSTFLEALTLDDLESSLDNSTGYPLEYTVFAPTNDAFEEILDTLRLRTINDVLNNGLLDSILQYHFLIQPYTAEQLVNLGTVGTNYKNQTLEISFDGTITAFGSNATVIEADIPACRSLVHIIDHVLVPDFDAVAPAPTSASI